MKPTLPVLEARVRLHRGDPGRQTKLLAFAELTIGGAFVIKNIQIRRRDEPGNDEPFVVFPAERGKGAAADRWYDIAHPCTPEARATALKAIMEAYAKATTVQA